MGYIKQNACNDLTLQEFQTEWKKLSPEEQEQLREWARAEGKVLGIEVE
jgi:hypothetical protein